ncbi:hypothetical protein [Bacillus atrophaeus]|uniref:hypothetical protein n=1 Tax=Bacillus atrophaeus TaxID=1452 RepID=UPI001C637CE0|nr:hypothetical protein [Bacillus atrophaeus]QYG88348.1 hypothetical protein HCU65_07605 [Bacillus atrophaeus]
MITPEDIEFMKQARADFVGGRTFDVTLFYTGEVERDPITGEPLPQPEPKKRVVPSVVTEISSQVKIDKYLADGIEIQSGDIWFSIAIELIEDIYDSLKSVIYDEKTYEILSVDKKGIGSRNRAEIVGRLRR